MPDNSFPYRLPPDLDALLGAHEDGDALRDMWELSGKRDDVAPDARRAAVRRAVLLTAEPRVRHLRLVAQHTFRFSSVAAALLVAVALAFLMGPEVHIQRADRGVAASVYTLPDGSTVTLAAGSRIAYDEDFGVDRDKRRTVRLRGRAYFDVEKTGAPFEVLTFNSATEVLGTTFSVEAWPGNMEAASDVVVSSGRVAMRSGDAVRELAPGDAARVVSGQDAPVALPDVNLERSLSWRTGGLAYENEPAGNVLLDLERRYGIVLSAPASIRLRRISYWKQHASDASEIIGDVAATVGVRYRPVKDGFELYLP